MIYALITLYNPTDEQINNINNIMEQVDCVVACDNSSYSNEYRIPSGCIYSSSEKNMGLSSAFNYVLKDKKYGWSDSDYIIFFDQDSKIREGHIQNLISDFENCLNQKINIGCIGPVYYNTSNDQLEIPHDKTEMLNGIYDVKSIITSSMLCRYKELAAIGFWNDEIFLDMADWDLCWRFMYNGYKCCMTTNTKITHSVGIGDKKIGPFHFRVGAPIREYYQIRDSQYLKAKDYTPLKFKIRFFAMRTIRCMIHEAFYDDSKLRMHYIKRGIKDYKANIHGEYCE